MTRNATPDILGEIMGIYKQEKNKAIKHPNNLTIEQESSNTAKQANTKTSKQEKNKAIKQANNLTTEQESSNAAKQANTKTSKQEKNITLNKEKATFNMSTQILEHLDEVWFKMKRMLKSKNQRITKIRLPNLSLFYLFTK